jgi:hypothetical protein
MASALPPMAQIWPITRALELFFSAMWTSVSLRMKSSRPG